MRKFLIIALVFILMAFQAVFADEVFKIKGMSFDTSSSIVFINTLGTYQSSITDGIKLVKLPDEHKIYFDIDSSILIGKRQDLFLSSGAIKEVKLSQFTTNPNVVRVVMYFNDNYNVENIQIGNINNNLVVMTQDLSERFTQFYQQVYRDKVKTSDDYYNPMKIQVQTVQAAPAVLNSNENYSQKELVQIQQAFGVSTAVESYKTLENSELNKNITLRSRYYINSVTRKNNGFLISGYGSPTIQKPFILAEPDRMIIDIVNSNINPNYCYKDIFLDPNSTTGDKLKIGNQENNVTRFVITSKDAKHYIPIFSPDNQSILIINPEKLTSQTITPYKTNLVQYKYQKNISTDDFTFTFDKPVIWGIKRNTDNLYVYFFNAAQYNETVFKNSIDETPFGNLELALLKNIGIRLTLPLTSLNDICTYFSADGKNFRIRATGLKPVKSKKKDVIVAPTPDKKLKGKIIVLDPGHGGTDYGAIRDGINEKDINLDVSRRVEDILKRRGYKVSMTRVDDTFVSLEDRCIISNSLNPAVFVSIHVNSCMGTDPKGIETHYYHENSIELANTIHNKMIKAIQTTNRGLFKSKFYVINHTEVPAVLLEIGFISNEKERMELITPQRKQATAQAIAEGIIEYIEHNK